MGQVYSNSSGGQCINLIILGNLMAARRFSPSKINIVMNPHSSSSYRRNSANTSAKRWAYCYRKKDMVDPNPLNTSTSYKFSDANYFENQRQDQHENNYPSYVLNNHQTITHEESVQVERIGQKSLGSGWMHREEQKPVKVKAMTIDIHSCGRNEKKCNEENWDLGIHKRHNIHRRTCTSVSSSRAQERKKPKINPYTNEEYLHYRKKEKEQNKKILEEAKKKEMLTNILKPCQIFKKKIEQREDLKKVSYEKSVDNIRAGVLKKNMEMQRAQTATRMGRRNPYSTLDPWESAFNQSKGLDEEYF